MFQRESGGKGFSTAPSHNVDLLASMRQPTSNYQSKTQFGTAAVLINNYQPKRLFLFGSAAALAFFKVLKVETSMNEKVPSKLSYRSLFSSSCLHCWCMIIVLRLVIMLEMMVPNLIL